MQSTSLLFSDILKQHREERYSLYIGLNVYGGNVSELAIEGGEDPKDYHVTLLYGYFVPMGDEEDTVVRVQSAIKEIQSDIPERLVFFHEHRFEASKSSDNKDVIVARVESGNLEKVHNDLIKALKKQGIRVETTFPQYIPHMTLAYIEPDMEYELRVLDHSVAVKDISVDIEKENSDSHDNTFHMVTKFNPYHDSKGRFTTSGGASSFTIQTRSKLFRNASNMAVEREKQRHADLMPTAEQAKTLKGIENRTRNLKKEQFRVVDRDGNVVMTKQGNKNSVSYTVGEAREHFPGNITVHNHPDGGTFSTADLSDIGHGATEIRAASPEGTYILRNMNYGTKWTTGQKSWIDMRDDIELAEIDFKAGYSLKKEVRATFADEQKHVSSLAEKCLKAMNSGASQDVIDGYRKEYDAAESALKVKVEKATRKAYTDQYHNWYKQNAHNYGLEYEFIPTKTRTTRVTKSHLSDFDFAVMQKSDGYVVLDADMNENIKRIVDEIMSELITLIRSTDMAKSFNEFVETESFSIAKADEDKRLVFGWALVSADKDGNPIIDHQKDIVDQDDLEEGAYEYVLNFRDAGEEHIGSLRKKARMVESCVFTEEKMEAIGIPIGTIPIGWWIGFYVDDDATWEKIKDGTYQMFSIEGKAIREPVEIENEPLTKALRNFDEFPEIGMWFEENMDATEEDIEAAKEYYKAHKKDKVAKTFSELLGNTI